MGILGGDHPGQARYSGELHNLQLQQAVFGTTVPIIIGTRRVAPKLLFYGGFYSTPAPSQGGKGLFGGKATQFEYYADIIGALASGSSAGACRGILNVWNQQGKLQNQSGAFQYTVPSGGGSVAPAGAGSPAIQMDLGVSKSAAYSVQASDYGSGGARTLSGTQMVPFTKVSGTPGAGEYSYNPSTGTYTFSGSDAGAQLTISYSSVFSLYYFQATQAAEVPLASPYQISTTNQQYFASDGGVVRVDTGAALVPGTDYSQNQGVYTFSAALAGVYVYINYTYTSSDANLTNSSTLNVTFFGGSLGQSPWSYMQSKYASSAFGYGGICYLGANPMALGMSAVMPNYNYEIAGLEIFAGGGLDAHPCDALTMLLTDSFLGVGFPSAALGDWTSAYAYWAANNYLISKTLDTQTSVADALAQVIEVGNVGAFFSEGLLKLAPYGDTTAVGNGYTYTPNTNPAATLTWDDMLPPSETQPGQSTHEDPLQVAQRAPQDCWNYVQAQWCNRENDYNNELINEQNDAFIAQYGRRIESPQTWDWITTAAAATWALNLRLKRQCYIRNSYKFWLSYRFAHLEPMDVILLPTGEPVRITSIEDSPDGRRAIEAEQFSYGSGDVTIYPKQSPSSFQPGIAMALPGDSIPVVLQQLPPQLGGNANALYIAAAGKSSNWGGCNVYASLDGTTYVMVDAITDPSAVGLLSAPLAYSADPDRTNTLSVDLTLSGTEATLETVAAALTDKFATLSAIVDQSGSPAELIAYETATLTAAGRYNLGYLRRGVGGSPISSHAAGALFAYLGPSFKYAVYKYDPSLAGTTLYLKLQSFNLIGAQAQPLSSCHVWQYQLGTGYVAPPTNVQLSVDAGSIAVLSAGNTVSAWLVTWTPPADPLVSNGGNIEVQYQLLSASQPPAGSIPSTLVNGIWETAWLDGGTFTGVATSWRLPTSAAFDGILVQVRARNSYGNLSAWVQATSAPGGPLKPVGGPITWKLGTPNLAPVIQYPDATTIEFWQPAQPGADVTSQNGANSILGHVIFAKAAGLTAKNSIGDTAVNDTANGAVNSLSDTFSAGWSGRANVNAGAGFVPGTYDMFVRVRSDGSGNSPTTLNPVGVYDNTASSYPLAGVSLTVSTTYQELYVGRLTLTAADINNNITAFFSQTGVTTNYYIDYIKFVPTVSLDENIADGSTYLRVPRTIYGASGNAIDANGNLKLKNAKQNVGVTVNPSVSSSWADLPELGSGNSAMTFALKGNPIEIGSSLQFSSISSGGVITNLNFPISLPTTTGSSPPSIGVTITGDGSGASASVSWAQSGSAPNFTWTPTLNFTSGGANYTTATCSVSVTSNGDAGYTTGNYSSTCTVSTPTGNANVPIQVRVLMDSSPVIGPLTITTDSTGTAVWVGSQLLFPAAGSHSFQVQAQDTSATAAMSTVRSFSLVELG